MLTKFVNAHLIKRIDKRLPLIKLMDMFSVYLNGYTDIHILPLSFSDFAKTLTLKTYFVTSINLDCDKINLN